MRGGFADHGKQPRLETGSPIENGFSTQNFQVGELQHVLGFVMPATTTAKGPAVAFDVVRFKRVAQPGVVEDQSGSIGQVSHVARSGDRVDSYAEHEQVRLRLRLNHGAFRSPK